MMMQLLPLRFVRDERDFFYLGQQAELPLPLPVKEIFHWGDYISATTQKVACNCDKATAILQSHHFDKVWLVFAIGSRPIKLEPKVFNSLIHANHVNWTRHDSRIATASLLQFNIESCSAVLHVENSALLASLKWKWLNAFTAHEGEIESWSFLARRRSMAHTHPNNW